MTKDSGFSHLVKKGDRAMLVTGVVLVAIMSAIVHSMLSGLTPMQSLLTPGATTVVQAQDDSSKTNSSKDNSENSDDSESQAEQQSEPKKEEKAEPQQSTQRATNRSAPRTVAPVKPPTVPKPSQNLINDVIRTADGLVEAILPIEVCVKLLAATC